MIAIHLEQGKWALGDIFWHIPKGIHIGNGDIIRVINRESAIGMYVVQEIARRDKTCHGCPFNMFMGSHNCLLVPNRKDKSYRRICDIPGSWTTSLRFTEIGTIMEGL